MFVAALFATAFALPRLKTDCNCDWTKTPGACGTPDGSYCWKVCCGGSGPTPSGPPTTPPPAGPGKAVNLVKEYMNKQGELTHNGGLNSTMANGFNRQGGMRYHSQEKLNLLGGGLSFTVDLSGVQDLVNANLYLVIPGTLEGQKYYCDNSGGTVAAHNACIELDIMEANGHKLTASTMHTKIGTSGHDCDTWGCRTITYSGTINMGAPFQVKVMVGADGNFQVQYSQNGKTAWAFNGATGFDGAAKRAIVDGMSNHGAVVVSSMWTGWVPPNTSANNPSGLAASRYVVSNLMYQGSSKGNTN